MTTNEPDPILHALAERARAEREDALSDRRWERAAAGRLSAEERAALARESGLDPTDAEAFAPLDTAARVRILGAATAALAKSAPAKGPRSGEVVAFPKRRVRSRVAIAVAAALALAAGVAMVASTHRDREAPVAALPSYELSVAGGIAATRSEPSGPVVLVRGAKISLSLRPATSVEGPVEARAFLVRAGEARPLALDVTVAPEGAVRLEGTLGDLFEPGPAELVVSIVRPGGSHDPLAAPAADARLARQPVTIGAMVP